MTAKKPPTSVTIRSYQVGFGDCFLVSFNYGEDAKAKPGATAPTTALRDAKGFVGALAAMHEVARFSLQEAAALRASKTVKEQIAFLGDDNLANLDAIKTLMDMKGDHVYAFYGSKSGLEKVLPGVKVHVL